LEVIEIVFVRRLGVENIQAATGSGLLPSSSRGGSGGLLLAEINKIRLRLFRGSWVRFPASSARRTGTASPGRARIPLFILVVLLEPVAPPAEILEVVRAASEPTPVSKDATAISPIPHAVAAKASVSAASTRQAASNAHAAFKAAELVPVGPGLLPLGTDHVDIAEQFDELRRPVAHVDTLVLPVLVDEMELTQHSQQRHMGSRIVDDSLRSVLDKELQELKALENETISVRS
jgi:hypothetical protein